jgi:methyl-accepting chemotaxis protein
MTIVKKLLISYAIFSLALLIIGFFGVESLKSSNERFDYMTANTFPSIKELSNTRNLQSAMRRDMLMSINAPSPEKTRTFINSARQNLDGMKKSLKSYYDNLLSNDADKALTVEDTRLTGILETTVNKFIEDYEQNGINSAKQRLSADSDMNLAINQLQQALMKHIDFNYQLAEDLSKENSSAYGKALASETAIIVGSFILAGIIAFSVLNYIRLSLSTFKHKMEYISTNLDLTESVDLRKNDEIGSTVAAFNHLLSRLRSSLTEIYTASTEVDDTASQVSASNDDLSARSETQSASLEQTAASMHEISSTVNNNMENAKHANQLMRQTENIFGQGETALNSLQESINAISHSSSKIADITNIIDSIAFQTNILALNAAVEAARAGEQGRGFAVVAGEVRTLSQRSAAAARDIKTLVEEAIANVNTGVQFAANVNDHMGKARNAISESTSIIDEVSTASIEQSHGVEQVNVAIGHMEGILQQNVSMVEEMSAAARSLSANASQLLEHVQVFKL